MTDKKQYFINLEKLLNVSLKAVALKAEVIETQEQLEMFLGSKMGDYILLHNNGQCTFMNKDWFEAIFQTFPSTIKLISNNSTIN